jgi:hypothetical protein
MPIAPPEPPPVNGLPAGLTLKGWTDDAANPANVASNGGALNLGTGPLTTTGAVTLTGVALVVGAIKSSPQASGSLDTIAFVSGAGKQVGAPTWDTDADLLYVPWTTDATNNVATLKVELSPDDMTYSELVTLSVAAAVNFVGALTQLLSLKVPYNWYVKLTAVHCTIGTGTVVAVID